MSAEMQITLIKKECASSPNRLSPPAAFNFASSQMSHFSFLAVAIKTGLAQTVAMNPKPGLRVRRATLDDLAVLRTIWLSMRLPAEELEKRLKEFQVVEDAEGNVLGTVGIQFLKPHALLYGEGFSDFSVADAARELFWERIQTLAANHGIFRIWTQETSPFWTRWGFQIANAEILSRLPEEWKTSEGKWFTLELKNEKAITAALESKFSGFMDAEKKQTARVFEKARTLKTVIIVVGFAIGILGIGIAIYLLIHRNQLGQ
jgi:N-acetylglutamate synthase-like GNAT family acetyltransferase